MPESASAAEDRGGMLGAPPAVGHIDDGHVEGAEDAQDGGQRLHLRAGGKAAQQQVADVDEPEDQGGGQPRVPGPPDAPGAASPERAGDEDDGAEDHADLGAGQRPGVGDLRPVRRGCGGRRESRWSRPSEMAKKRKATMAEGTW